MCECIAQIEMIIGHFKIDWIDTKGFPRICTSRRRGANFSAALGVRINLIKKSPPPYSAFLNSQQAIATSRSKFY